MEKMKVVPVNVPWMISPAYEIDKYYGGISFVNISLYCINSQKQRNIEIHFEPISYFGIVYSQQEVFDLDEEKYDISILKPYYDGTLDLNDVWNEKDFCPNPKMYEIQNSVLKKV